jgi:hypothetical protein
MGKRKQSDRHPTNSSATAGADSSSDFNPDSDEFSVAAYREGRSWLEATAVSLQRAHLVGSRPPHRVDPLPGEKLPLRLHRPSVEAHWQARSGTEPFTRQQRREIVDITEFSYEDLLQPAVLYAPLYAELAPNDRQRMIVRTFFKEALASFMRAGLGPANTLGPKATRELAWLCAFSAGVVLGLPTASLQFIDYIGLVTDLNKLVRDGGGAGLRRVWTDLTTVVIALETTIGMEGIFYPHRPRKSSGGGSNQ